MHRSSQSLSSQRIQEGVTASLLPNRNSSSGRNRRSELAAAFDSGDEDEEEEEEEEDESRNASASRSNSTFSDPLALPSYSSNGKRKGNHQEQSQRNSNAGEGEREREREVFFDAAMEDESATTLLPRQSSSSVTNHHPLENDDSNSSYNFETPSYFSNQPFHSTSNSNSPSNNNSNHGSTSISHQSSSPSNQNVDQDDDVDEDDGTGRDLQLGFADLPSNSNSNSNSNSTSQSNNHNGDNLSKIRFLLGRFGRFVGMRVPGANYSTLSQQEDNDGINRNSNGLSNGSGNGNGVGGRRRVMGGGIGQDGVFANLNAKPERRRRVRDGADDRGEDDDLEDSALPPTYNAAAADSAPPYWETTIISGPGLGGLHPLAPGGMGWTPGGTHVGEIEDLIVEGLPVGNLFGFAWNLLVSVCFQFVGFLLTYLLHTTHASKCGSRAGLGITLIQYGFYLRTKSLEEDLNSTSSSSSSSSGITNPNGSTIETIHTWWGGDIEIERPSSSIMNEVSSNRKSEREGVMSEGHTSTLADLIAASADSPGSENNPPGNSSNSISESLNGSTEWLSYLLMILGWFILLSSLLSYWRVHRWGKQLVDGARRDRESNNNNNDQNNNTTSASTTTNENNEHENLSMLERLRARISGNNNSTNSNNNRNHSAEDWLVFPGLGHRHGVSSETGNGIGNSNGYNLDLENGLNDEEGNDRRVRNQVTGDGEEDDDSHNRHMSPEERRLFNDMRVVGLIG